MFLVVLGIGITSSGVPSEDLPRGFAAVAWSAAALVSGAATAWTFLPGTRLWMAAPITVLAGMATVIAFMPVKQKGLASGDEDVPTG